jgi:hypothetical protein
MKTGHTKISGKLIIIGIILVSLGLGLGSCSGPHHGSGNHRNHMTNSMGG